MSKCKGAVFPGRWRIAIFRVMDVMMAKTDNRANIWQSWWIYDYKPYKIYKVNNWSNVQTLTTLTIYYKLSWMPKYWMLYTLLKIIYSAISGQCHLLGNWLIDPNSGIFSNIAWSLIPPCFLVFPQFLTLPLLSSLVSGAKKAKISWLPSLRKG